MDVYTIVYEIAWKNFFYKFPVVIQFVIGLNFTFYCINIHLVMGKLLTNLYSFFHNIGKGIKKYWWYASLTLHLFFINLFRGGGM